MLILFKLNVNQNPSEMLINPIISEFLDKFLAYSRF
jgi:hypothetical protein